MGKGNKKKNSKTKIDENDPESLKVRRLDKVLIFMVGIESW
jgi:hypothetical protein